MPPAALGPCHPVYVAPALAAVLAAGLALSMALDAHHAGRWRLAGGLLGGALACAAGVAAVAWGAWLRPC